MQAGPLQAVHELPAHCLQLGPGVAGPAGHLAQREAGRHGLQQPHQVRDCDPLQLHVGGDSGGAANAPADLRQRDQIPNRVSRCPKDGLQGIYNL